MAQPASDQVKPLSEKLVAELTAYRTAGLRNALAEHPATALTAVVHALAAAAFYVGSGRSSCLEIVPATRLRSRRTLPASMNVRR